MSANYTLNANTKPHLWFGLNTLAAVLVIAAFIAVLLLGLLGAGSLIPFALVALVIAEIVIYQVEIKQEQRLQDIPRMLKQKIAGKKFMVRPYWRIRA